MNIILNPRQSNTKREDVTYPASVNLTGCENLLWKILNASGVANFALPTATDDEAVYVGASGDIAGNPVSAESPGLGENCRVTLDGTCNPGDLLSLSPNIYGRLYKPTTGAGTIRYQFIAEEAGIAGQDLLVRRICERTATL